VLSRFLSSAEQKAVAAGLTNGEVDVVIGTHRLLSEDIAFKDHADAYHEQCTMRW